MAHPPLDLDEYRRAAEELLAAPGPTDDERGAGLFTAEALAGLRARGATALARFAAEGLLRRASADEMAEILVRLAEPVVEGPGGLLAPAAVNAALAAEPDRERRRALQAGRLRALENRLGPLLAEARGRREQAAVEAGAASPEELLAGAAGLDLGAVAAHGSALLDATDDASGAALARAAQDALGGGGAEAADLPRIVRAPQLDAEVSSPGARDVAARTLELLELELPAGPPAPSGGREGLALWLETLGALGAALAAAGASPRLPFERRRLADPALARSSGLLLEGLAADPSWLQRAAGLADPDAAARAAAAARLLAARAAAARAVALAGEGEPGLMSRAAGVDWPAALSLADGLAGLGPADELRALALSAALRAHLRDRHGARWFAEPGAGRLLRELWLEGGRPRPGGARARARRARARPRPPRRRAERGGPVTLALAGRVLSGRRLTSGEVAVADGRIAPGAPRGARRALPDGWIVSPGLVNLQINGYAGVEVDGGPGALARIAAALPAIGVTAFCPTLISRSEGGYRRAAAALARVCQLATARVANWHIARGPGPRRSPRGAVPCARARRRPPGRGAARPDARGRQPAPRGLRAGHRDARSRAPGGPGGGPAGRPPRRPGVRGAQRG